MRRLPTSLLCTSALLLSAAACSDDDATTLAKADDVTMVGDGLGEQTLSISAEETDGEVTGEFQVSEVLVAVECADTDTDGIVVLGGEVTTGAEDTIAVGELLALAIREGDPDSVALIGNDDGAASCTELLESRTEDVLADDSGFVDLAEGEDIETG